MGNLLEWAYEKCPATSANRPGPAEPLIRDGRSDMEDRTCSIGACGRPVRHRGWCKRHYGNWRRAGDPLAAKPAKPAIDIRVRLESHIDRSGGPDACHPWTAGRHAEGYGWVRVGKTSKLAHMAVWEVENGPKPEGAQLDHECHNRAVREGICRPGKCPHRLCCNLRHIVARSSKDEHFDATVPWDRSAWAHSTAKLTEDQVREIRAFTADGRLVSRRFDLAERYGVRTETIWRVATGRAYAWVSDVA